MLHNLALSESGWISGKFVGNLSYRLGKGLPVTRPAIRIGPLGIPRLLDEYISDHALVETTKRILVETLVREPFVGGNRLQVSRPDETRSRTRNCQCAAYIPDRAERDALHELLANQFSSVARNYVEEAYQIERMFPMDN